MQDVREVYEMVTKQKPPEPGALERQQRRQVRTARNRRLGAFVAVAAIGLIAVALLLSSRTGGSTIPAVVPSSPTLPLPTPEGPTGEAAAEQIVRDFLYAYGTFDARDAMHYVADDDADLTGLIEQAPPNEQGLALWLSWLEAQHFEHAITSCATDRVGSDFSVACGYNYHMIRSQELGRGPFRGSGYAFTVRDGYIVRADLDWNIDEFSPQMWEPFADWVNVTHPKEFEVMFNDDGTNYELTSESVRLWKINTKRYVDAVRAGNAE